MLIIERTLKVLQLENGKIPFEEWYSQLSDQRTRVSIAARLTNLQNESFRNFKYLQGGVYELRIFLGPGYRVYFSMIGNAVVVLLGGGDKRSQNDDIKKAKRIWAKYKNAIERYQRDLAL